MISSNIFPASSDAEEKPPVATLPAKESSTLKTCDSGAAGGKPKPKAGDNNKAAIKLILETMFGELLVTEHKFHPSRRWRFDYAIPEIKLAMEYQGHAGFAGRAVSGHSTIKGLTNDCEKFNSAIGLGWRVLTFTAWHFRLSDRVKHKLTDFRTTVMNTIAEMQNQKESTLNHETTPQTTLPARQPA